MILTGTGQYLQRQRRRQSKQRLSSYQRIVYYNERSDAIEYRARPLAPYLPILICDDGNDGNNNDDNDDDDNMAYL